MDRFTSHQPFSSSTELLMCVHSSLQAVDPRIMDVKRRVRAARRDLKRDSKVGLSDEIIFFDDVAGNARAKVGGQS